MIQTKCNSILISAILIIYAPCCSAADYSFVKVADSNAGQFRYVNIAQLNDQNQVAFDARLADESLGIALWENGASELAVITGQPFENGRLSIPTRSRLNNDGTIAFSAVRFGTVQTGYQGVFTVNDGDIRRIAPLDPDAYHFSATLAINDTGLVAFDAPSPSFNSILAGDGTRIYPIAPADEFRASMLVGDLNNTGKAAFYAFGIDERTLYVSDGIQTTVIARAPHTAQPGNPFDDLGGIKINDQDVVVFRAHLRDDGYALYQNDGGALTEIESGIGNEINLIEGFDNNDFGDILFSATLDQGGTALFLQTAAGREKILQTGDILLGEPISGVGAGEINNNGVIMFAASRADGSFGLYLAIPEPMSLALGLVASFVLLVGLIRRRTAC
jgi:hypothetical protein